MSATRPIIDAVAAHLQAAIPWVSVDVFPVKPLRIVNLSRPVWAVLVGYQSRKFI
ncbi:hypothetical protein [Kingella kingae]|uniref:hypothetical protein n=1 Tax=Kingella kingae TaxID=504 RepID=UPI0003F9BA0D|nr:hypothetical protein [Kingella kingae]